MRSVRIMGVCLGLSLLVGMSLALAQTEPTTVVLKGAPNGDVTFNHKAHTKAAAKCQVCHHASRPEKPTKSETQACRDCHTKAATPPMKTKLQAAFHNPMAKAGVCIDCHLKQASGSKVPSKCTDCHKKA